MKRFNKRILSVAVSLTLMAIALTSCGSSGAKVPDDYKYGDLTQYIKLADYKGIEYKKVTGDVSADEIKSYVDSQVAATEDVTEIKEGTVKKDSIVNIDYVGSVDGVEFEGGAAQNQELDIANSHYIEGFAEGIVGHKVGETFDLHVTFPEDYGNEELNGKDAVFKTTINFMVEKKEAKYNDTWVANNSEYKTTKEYENYVKEQLSKEKLDAAESTQMTEVFQKLIDGSEIVEYPEKEIASRAEQFKKMYNDYATSSGMDLDTFLSQMGMDAETFETTAQDSAKNTVKQELILHAIKDSEGIEVNQKGYNEYLQGLLETSGMTDEDFKSKNGKTIAEYADENNMFTTYLYKEVMQKVMEYSVGK